MCWGDIIDKKVIGISLIIVIVLIGVVAIAGLGFDIGIGGGYKVTVTGSVSHDSNLAGGAWHCSCDGATYMDDPGLFSINPLGLIDTEAIVVEATIEYGDKIYESSQELPSIGTVLGGTESYNIDIRHVKPGLYLGTVNVYEVEKALFGLGWETDRSLKCSKTFEINVEKIINEW